MALTLNAEQKSIYNIFSGENQYVIPPYQRAYSWTNTQCKALFEDIKKAFYETSQEGYFLGNIVLAKSREEKNRLEVIDGQQRLTSLTLLLKVLLSFDKENKALYDAIWIKDRRTDEEMQRVETNVFMEKDFNYFKEVLGFDFSKDICASVSKEDNLFKKNICYFYKELNEFSKNNDILKFSDFLLDNVYILPIETEDNNADKARKNALQIFETINNRGLNLSISDIFKAKLYSMALNDLEHKSFIKLWKELNNKCIELNYSIDSLFKVYSYTFTDKKINIREYFLENNNSPFYHKRYDEIINDLLKICNFILFFIEIINNPKENNELSKWSQLIHQGILIGVLNEVTFYQFLNSNKFSLEDNSLINVLKKIVYTNAFFKMDSLKERNKSFFKKEQFSLKDCFFILLGLTLDENQKAIDPYHIFSNNIEPFTNNFKIENEIEGYINYFFKIFKLDNIKIDSLSGEVYYTMLITIIPRLDNEKECINLINKAYKFIRKANQNEN